MAASKKVIEDLHEALANAFTKIVKEGVQVTDKEGNLVTLTTPASYLNVARQFVKDNDVQAAPLPGTPLGNLVNSLPFAGEDEGDAVH